MAEKQKNNEQILNFELPSGINVEMDISKFTVAKLTKARALANGGEKTALYIFADICKFDGESLNVPEIEKLPGYDYIMLEEYWAKGKQLISKKSQPQT